MCIDSSANRGGERSMQEGLEREGIPSFFDRNLQEYITKTTKHFEKCGTRTLRYVDLASLVDLQGLFFF